MIAADAVMLPAILWAGLALKYGDPAVPVTHGDLFVIATVSAIIIFALLGLYRAIIRFIGPQVMVTIVIGTALSVGVLGVYDRLHGTPFLPWSVLAIYSALALLYLVASRFAVRYLFYYGLNGHGTTRVAIYGAGEAGAKLSAALLAGSDFQPVAFIDDNLVLRGSRINGIKVFDAGQIKAVIENLQIGRVLLAMPSTSRRRRAEILDKLEPLGVHVQSLPDLSDIIAGKARLDQINEVDVDDLLGRDPVPPNPTLFERSIRDKCVMVTGAGGSIGSELCRQILHSSPRRLVLFEMSEVALYQIDRDLSSIIAKDHLS